MQLLSNGREIESKSPFQQDPRVGQGLDFLVFSGPESNLAIEMLPP